MNSPFGTLNMELSQSNYGTLMPLWEQKSMRNEMFTSAWNNGLTGDDALEVGIAYARAFNMWGNEGVVESAVAARINYDFSGGIDWQYAVAFEDTDPKDGSCATCVKNYPVPEFWSLLGVDQATWNNLVSDFITTEEHSRSVPMNDIGRGIMMWLSYGSPFEYLTRGNTYLINLLQGQYSESHQEISSRININTFLNDPHVVDLLKDSTTNGASDAGILILMRRNSTVKFPKGTKNR